MPKVSIIIPTYNRASTIQRAITSALTQTYRDKEIIVVDDGSTDETSAVTLRFGESIKYIQQANAGPESARNHGVAASTGEYIYFLDSDDELAPDAVTQLASLLDSDRHATIAYGVSRTTDSKGNHTGIIAPRYDRMPGSLLGHEELKHLLMCNYICTGAVALRRSAWTITGGFDASFGGTCEDWDLWIRLASLGNVGFSPAMVLTVHAQSDSLMALFNGKVYRQIHKYFLDRARNDPALWPFLQQSWKHIEAQFLIELATDVYYTDGDIPRARELVSSALHLYPEALNDREIQGADVLWRTISRPVIIAQMTRTKAFAELVKIMKRG